MGKQNHYLYKIIIIMLIGTENVQIMPLKQGKKLKVKKKTYSVCLTGNTSRLLPSSISKLHTMFHFKPTTCPNGSYTPGKGCFLIQITPEFLSQTDNLQKIDNVNILQNISIDLISVLNLCTHSYLNSSPPDATYMCQWIGSALVQIIACRLFGTKPLSEPMLEYY